MPKDHWRRANRRSKYGPAKHDRNNGVKSELKRLQKEIKQLQELQQQAAPKPRKQKQNGKPKVNEWHERYPCPPRKSKVKVDYSNVLPPRGECQYDPTFYGRPADTSWPITTRQIQGFDPPPKLPKHQLNLINKHEDVDEQVHELEYCI